MNEYLYLQVESLMEMFSGGPLEHKVMQKAGCMDYSPTEWELVKRNMHQRQISYKFDKSLSRYGGEATTTQQKYALVNQDGWAIEEVMTLQGVLLGDYFNVRCPLLHTFLLLFLGDFGTFSSTLKYESEFSFKDKNMNLS